MRRTASFPRLPSRLTCSLGNNILDSGVGGGQDGRGPSDEGEPGDKGAGKRVCLVIYAYGDDGSDQKRERASSVSIIAGREEWWEQIESDWVTRCGGIPFHATDCESDTNDYEGIPHEQNKAMYRDLTGILAASKLGGIGVAVDLAGQKRILPGGLPFVYYRSFSECILRVAKVAENLEDMAKVTFDISTENEYNAGLLYSQIRGDGTLAHWLHSEISFVPWKDSPRVQTADLLAFEAWKALDHVVGPTKRRRKSWELLRATGRFETIAYGEEWLLGLKKYIDSGEAERIVGFNEADYLLWLKESGRKHSVSNVIHFLGTRKK